MDECIRCHGIEGQCPCNTDDALVSEQRPTERETVETDGVVWDTCGWEDGDSVPVVDYDFARTLERAKEAGLI